MIKDIVKELLFLSLIVIIVEEKLKIKVLFVK